MRFVFHVPTLCAALLLTSCAIPPRPQTPSLTQAAPLAGLATQADAAWPEQNWWTQYSDAQLDELEARALSQSPTLAVARARFDVAIKSVAVARAADGLNIDGDAQVQRHRLSEHGLIPSKFLGFTWYNLGDLGITANYDFDFWGSHGAAIDAAIGRARAAQAQRASAQAVLTAAVAQTYFAWQTSQARSAIAQEIVNGYARGRAIVAARVSRGLSADDMLQQADSLLAAAREQVVMHDGQARIQQAALAGLLGVAPADLPTLVVHALPVAKAVLPANAGIDLVARRADVAASRWRVEAALKDVDVARDAFYPNVSLSAMAGLSSIELGKLLSPASAVFAAGPALHLPIFQGGRLRARFGVSTATLAAAVADYNAAVIDAARDVAAQALTLEQIQDRQHQDALQITAKTQLLASARARMQRGLTDAIPVLNAAESLDRQRDASVQLQAAALAAEIELNRALGGGYHAEAVTAPLPLSGNPSP